MPLKDSSNSSQTHPDSEVSPIEINILKQLNDIMGPELMNSMIQQFMVYSSQAVAVLQNYNTQSDISTLRHQAHQFKGESLQIGAFQLGALCESLELAIQKKQSPEVIAEILVKIKAEIERVNAALIQVSQNDYT